MQWKKNFFFLLADKAIYMILEGRRYWPRIVRDYFLNLERARLLNIHKTMRKHDTHRNSNTIKASDRAEFDRIYLENAVVLAQFPLSERTMMPVPLWPTRAGNLIAAYEQYSYLKYGMDSVFFWPRIWLSMDGSVREEIDNSQAQADGAIYAAVSFAISGLVIFLFSIIKKAGWIDIGMGLFNAFVVLIVMVFLSYLFYRVSLFSLQQFGDLFMSSFDKYRNSIDFKEIEDMISSHDNIKEKSLVERNMAIWRFLKWQRLRKDRGTSNVRARLP